jgi:hypothetical protein
MRTTNRLGAIPLTMDRNICAKLVSLDKVDGKKEGGQTRTFCSMRRLFRQCYSLKQTNLSQSDAIQTSGKDIFSFESDSSS